MKRLLETWKSVKAWKILYLIIQRVGLIKYMFYLTYKLFILICYIIKTYTHYIVLYFTHAILLLRLKYIKIYLEIK